MKEMARITFENGGFISPAKTPYDRQLLFEQVAQYTRRRGHIRLDLDREEWSVALANAQSRLCAVCGQQPDNLAYVQRERTLCHPCARRTLG